MAGGFTLDSATVILFGKNAHSLAAPVPVPYAGDGANSNSVAYGDNWNGGRGVPAPGNANNNRFGDVLAPAQHIAAIRTRLGRTWPFNGISRISCFVDQKEAFST
jgi:hypothetical protein